MFAIAEKRLTKGFCFQIFIKTFSIKFWKSQESGDFDEETTDDWDVDMSVYYEKELYILQSIYYYLDAAPEFHVL